MAFNVPGNGYDDVLIENYLDFNARDVAKLFLEGIKILKIQQLYAIIGGSVGGGIAWEMVALEPKNHRTFNPDCHRLEIDGLVDCQLFFAGTNPE